jgi:hypothetical protein
VELELLALVDAVQLPPEGTKFGVMTVEISDCMILHSTIGMFDSIGDNVTMLFANVIFLFGGKTSRKALNFR